MRDAIMNPVRPNAMQYLSQTMDAQSSASDCLLAWHDGRPEKCRLNCEDLISKSRLYKSRVDSVSEHARKQIDGSQLCDWLDFESELCVVTDLAFTRVEIFDNYDRAVSRPFSIVRE
jgi:hypothetical protein